MTPVIQRLNNSKPIIEKIESHPWENKVTFNPGCALVTEEQELKSIITALPFSNTVKKELSSHPALCFLLYRAQGKKTNEYDHTRSAIGLAVLTPELKLLARHDEPVLKPDREYENLGIEDGRISKVGDRYVMMYCAYSSAEPENRIRIALASTKNFVQWEKHGLLKGDVNDVHNKNAMLFEGKVNGKFLMMHRPMEGSDALSIHLAESDDVFGEWKSRGVFMKPKANPEFKDTWIGGGAPPLLMEDGRFLILYHIGNRKADGVREYDFGIAVADFSKPDVISSRIDPLLRPESVAETTGDAELGVNNVVFVCGAYWYRGDFIFPYAGADSVILGGKIEKQSLEQYHAKVSSPPS